MSNQSYQKTIVVKANTERVFAALTRNIEYWWTKPDNAIVKEGDKAKFTFPPGRSYWTFEATSLTPNQVKLRCVDALHLHEGMPSAIETEWLGSQLIFNMTQKGQSTQIDFEHQGLIPQLHCYEVCENGWDYFFLESLQHYLDTGTGSPHRE